MATIPKDKIVAHAKACTDAANLVKFWLIHETPEELQMVLSLKEKTITVFCRDYENPDPEQKEWEQTFTW